MAAGPDEVDGETTLLEQRRKEVEAERQAMQVPPLPESQSTVLKSDELKMNDSSKTDFCGDGRAVIRQIPVSDTEQVFKVTAFQDLEDARFEDCRMYNAMDFV
jgi:hypothetical protein